MNTAVIAVYLVVLSASLLVLMSLGLAVIFGMMKVINLAHGEFMMVGGYACVATVDAGAPLWVGIVAGGLSAGVLGLLVERLVIRFLYGRIVDSLLATWGLSLLMIGAATTLFGVAGHGISADFGNIDVGGVQILAYNLVLVALAVLLLVVTWAIARYSKWGLLVRGTMQKPLVASCFGVNRSRVYMATFAFGCALAGIAGAALAPITSVTPTMGGYFIAKAFITVIAGGPQPLLGTITAASVFGVIDGSLSFLWGSVIGEISILVVAVLLLRVFPTGITGSFGQQS